MKDFAKSIRTNNCSVCNKAIVLKDGNVWVVLYANETKSKEFETEAEAREFAKKVGNSKVGNGSGSWRGKFYEDSAGNSASLEKRGEGWEVYWEDARGYGKPLGKYKDERTAREVAEAAVESEMPDRIRASYKSKAINSRVGNSSKFNELESIISEASMYAESANRILNGTFSATNIINYLSKCKQACDIAIKRAQEYDKELQAKK